MDGIYEASEGLLWPLGDGGVVGILSRGGLGSGHPNDGGDKADGVVAHNYVAGVFQESHCGDSRSGVPSLLPSLPNARQPCQTDREFESINCATMATHVTGHEDSQHREQKDSFVIYSNFAVSEWGTFASPPRSVVSSEREFGRVLSHTRHPQDGIAVPG